MDIDPEHGATASGTHMQANDNQGENHVQPHCETVFTVHLNKEITVGLTEQERHALKVFSLSAVRYEMYLASVSLRYDMYRGSVCVRYIYILGPCLFISRKYLMPCSAGK